MSSSRSTELLSLMASSIFVSEDCIKTEIYKVLNQFLVNSIGDSESIGIVLWSSLFYRFDNVAYSIMFFLHRKRSLFSPETVCMIVNHPNGAFINNNVMESPLHLAAFNINNQSNVINLLLRLGANPWAKNSEQKIPIEIVFKQLANSSDRLHRLECYRVINLLLYGMIRMNFRNSSISQKFVDSYIFPRIIELNDPNVLKLLDKFKFNFDSIVNFAHLRYANAKKCRPQIVEYFKKIAMDREWPILLKQRQEPQPQQDEACETSSSSSNKRKYSSPTQPQAHNPIVDDRELIWHPLERESTSNIRVTIVGNISGNDNCTRPTRYIYTEDYENPYPALNYEPILQQQQPQKLSC